MLEPTQPLRTVWRKAAELAGTVWRSPWLTIGALALFAVQTVRIDGFQVRAPIIGTVGPQGWKPRALSAESDRAALIKAAQQNYEAQLAQKKAQERKYADLANPTDEAVAAAQSERERADRFIAAGGVRAEVPACRVTAAAPARNQSAGISAPVRPAPVVDDASDVRDPEPATVSVLPRDVRICTDNTILAEQFREFILGLEAASQPEE